MTSRSFELHYAQQQEPVKVLKVAGDTCTQKLPNGYYAYKLLLLKFKSQVVGVLILS